MAEKDSIEIGTEAERARYAAMTPGARADAAQELANEVLDHYDHTRALVAALIAELRAYAPGPEETKHALQLAAVTDAWLNNIDHLEQESRLFACLQASVAAHYESRGLHRV